MKQEEKTWTCDVDGDIISSIKGCIAICKGTESDLLLVKKEIYLLNSFVMKTKIRDGDEFENIYASYLELRDYYKQKIFGLSQSSWWSPAGIKRGPIAGPILTSTQNKPSTIKVLKNRTYGKIGTF